MALFQAHISCLLPLSVLPFLYLLMRRAVAPLRIKRTFVMLLLSLSFVYVASDFAENAAVVGSRSLISYN